MFFCSEKSTITNKDGDVDLVNIIQILGYSYAVDYSAERVNEASKSV